MEDKNKIEVGKLEIHLNGIPRKSAQFHMVEGENGIVTKGNLFINGTYHGFSMDKFKEMAEKRTTRYQRGQRAELIKY